MTAIDRAGIRALVRGTQTSQRLAAACGSRPCAAVHQVLDASRLASIFETYTSVDSARWRLAWHKVRVILAGAALCGALVWTG